MVALRKALAELRNDAANGRSTILSSFEGIEVTV